MIRHFIHIWLVMMALAGLLVGCHGAPHYDSSLIQADSLLKTPGQRLQALQLLEDFKSDSLVPDHDRAYYHLLLTQARYMNYITFDSTSLQGINTAIDYYCQHDKDIEKLSRAYIYKGTVLEDMLRPDSAMLCYKRAEVIANENDHFNRGYANLRMGKLYARHHAYDGRDIEKLEQALDHFNKSGDTYYQIICLNDLGALYRSTDTIKSQKNLNMAITLAEQEKDVNNAIKSRNNLAYLYFMLGQHDKKYNLKAYKQLQHIKQLYGLKGLPDGVYATFASVYANLGKTDSALLLLELPQYSDTARAAQYRQSNNYLEALSHIAKAQGDSLNYLKLSHECDRKSFQALNDPDIVNIMFAELSFDEQHQKDIDRQRRFRTGVIAAVVGAIILALLALALLFYYRAHRYDKLVLELKDRSQSQINDLSQLQGNINELKINDVRLKGFIASHMDMMREMIETCYHEPNNRIAESMKRIVKFQDSNKENWVKLYDYIDLEHDNIMTRTRENYPQLNDRELLLLALTCMGYSYIHIAIIMGYSNATSVSVIKQRLVKKMGLECSLNDYIQNNGRV